MKNCLLVLFLLLHVAGYGQTRTICNQAVPAGWVTTAMNTCQNGYYTYDMRTIVSLATYKVGAKLTICNDNVPAGWVTIAMNRCVNGIYSYEARDIQNIGTALPNGSTLTICNDKVPAGWVTTAMSTCRVGVYTYESYLAAIDFFVSNFFEEEKAQTFRREPEYVNALRASQNNILKNYYDLMYRYYTNSASKEEKEIVKKLIPTLVT